MTRLLAVLAISAAACVLAACGSTASGEDDEVRKVVTDFYAALASSDFEKACILVSGNAELGGAECESAVEAVEVQGDYDPSNYGDFVIEQVELSGDAATVELQGDEGVSKLVNSASGWLISENTVLEYGVTLLAISDIEEEAHSLDKELAGFE